MERRSPARERAELDQHALPAALDGDDPTPGQTRRDGPPEPVVEDSQTADSATDEVGLQLARDGLDFGQLRHRAKLASNT
jgi:hypothetical protein